MIRAGVIVMLISLFVSMASTGFGLTDSFIGISEGEVGDVNSSISIIFKITAACLVIAAFGLLLSLIGVIAVLLAKMKKLNFSNRSLKGNG